MNNMKRKWMVLVLLGIFLIPAWADALEMDNFAVDTTDDLVGLCTVSQSNPLQKEAVNFCLGFLVGAYHYHVAQNAGPKGNRMVCLPDPPPARSKVANLFVDWAKKHSQYGGEEAVETWFRFLMETYPCK